MTAGQPDIGSGIIQPAIDSATSFHKALPVSPTIFADEPTQSLRPAARIISRW